MKKAHLPRAVINVAALFLVTVVTVLPLESAFAQSTDTATSASTDSVVSDTTTAPSNIPAAPDNSAVQAPATDSTPAPDASTPAPSAPSDATASPAPADASSPTSPSTPTDGTPTQQPTNPTNPTSPTSPVVNSASQLSSTNPQPVIPGTFNQDLLKIDKKTGALNTTFPLDIPPGRDNLQPYLRLSYNSQDARMGSIFGQGWSINIPYIERLNKTGTDNLYSTSTPQYFTSSLDGELATTSASSSFIARTDNGTFNKYTFSNNRWVMTDKNGTQFTFGTTTASQENDPNNTGNVYRWMLTQVRDTNNNYIAYNYFKDAGQIYPSSTLYTGSGSTDGIFEVDFLRTSSTDNGTSSAMGFAVKSNYRINEIDAKVNGSWVRKYALAYTTGDNGSTTLLSSITETGKDSQNNTVSLPATTFSYKTQTAGWTSNATWVPPVALSAAGAPNGTVVVDVNGDGLPDILYANYFYDGINGWHTEYHSYINNGHGWTDDSSWYAPIALSNTGTNDVRIADVNGDGLPDLLYANYFYDGINGWHTDYSTYINNGHGWTLDASWNPPLALEGSGQDNGVKIVDVNGDGLPDLLYENYFYAGSWQTTYGAYINNGHGWTNNPAWYSPVVLSNNDSDIGVRVVDVNGDGLPDLVYNDAVLGTPYTYINNGNGWTLDASWTSPVALSSNGGPNGTQIIDANGDGLPDIVYSDTFYGTPFAYLDNGHGWTSNSAWIPPINLTDHVNQSTRLVDINGDGLPDIIYNDSSWGTSGGYANNNSVRADISINTTYPQGGSTATQYKAVAQFTDGSNNLVNKVPYPIYLASQITNNDGSQNVSSSTYQYASGTYYFASPYDRQFAGFNLVATNDAAGNVTKTYYHTGTGSDSAHGEYADNFWKIGEPYRVEAYDNASHLYKKTINKWDSYSLGGNAAFVKLAQTVESDYDGLSIHKDLAEAYTYDNATGNQTEKIQWGQVTGSDDGTFTDTGSDKYTMDATFATSTTGVIGKPSDVTVTDQSSAKVKESRYYYDTLSLGSVSLGNLTKEEDWKTGSTYVNTQNTYNGYGLVTQNLDPRGKPTNYSYDSYNLYPSTITNALSQATQYQYDYSTGKPTQTIDPNNDTFQTTYDGLGRPVQIIQPDTNTSSTLVTKTTYAYVDTANAVSVHEADSLDGSSTVDTYSYYDGLNRLIQTRKSAEDAGTFKVSDRAYNPLGLLQKGSLPYFASSSAKAAPTSTTALLVNYTYDSLGRVLTIANAVGTTTNAYANWKVTTTDPRGKPKDQYSDAYGNLIQVDEHSGASTYSTYYTYDGLKDLTKITDALGNVRNFTYDGLGRRLTAQDLHAPADATYGTWNYTYDDAGNLTQTVDPKSQTINYTYDDTNRVLTEDYTGQAGTEISYTYDSCVQGIMRLCVASSSDAVVSSTYNGLGALAQETKTIGTSTYATSYTYDRQGNQLTITNPDNSQVQYTYNLAGLIETLSRKESGGSFVSVVSNFDYSPTDQPATIAYANGVTVANTYDPIQTYRLSHKVSTLPNASKAQDLTYSYDADGNITQLVDASASGTGKTVNYTYDDLSRMTVASTTNASTSPNYSQTFAYDALGNIATGPAGTYSYSGNTGANYADPDAVTSIGTSTYAYDNNGNLTSYASTTNTWNYRNRLTQSVNGAGTSTYAYDYQDNRVKLVENGATTIFPTKFFNAMIGGNSTTTKHIFANGLLVATVENSTTTTSGRTTSTIALDATSTNITTGFNAGPTTKSWTHTVTGTNPVLILMADILQDASGTGSVASATWKGAAFTKVKTARSVTMESEVWYLSPTSTGSGTLSVTITGATDAIKLGAASFTGVSTSTPLDASSTATGTSGNPNVSLVTATSSDLVIATLSRASTTDATTNRVSLFKDETTSTLAAGSYQLATSTGTYSDTYTGSATKNWSMVIAAFKPALVYNSTSTATSTVRYALDDQLGGSNAIISASGTIVEILDYYPYGQARLDTKSGPYDGEKRKFIGQEYDSESGLDYLNARYYDGNRGQFLSEDPSFLAVGGLNQVRQVTGEDQQAFLSDPQQLGSYSYGRDNPIVNRDATGRYWELSGSIVIPGRIFSAGIQIDQYGIVGFFGGGLGYGGGGGLEVGWAPGQSVSHQRNTAISVSGEYADVFGGRISQNISQYSPDTGGPAPIGGPSYALMFGAGGGVGIQQQLSAPLPYLTWGHPPIDDSQQQTGQPQSVNNLSKTYLSQGYSQLSYGGSPSSNSGGSLGHILTSLSNLISQLSAGISSIRSKTKSQQ